MTPEQQQFLLGLDKEGFLSATDVVRAAVPEDSPIHEFFTWDDNAAGIKLRLIEARTLIRQVRVEYLPHPSQSVGPVYIHNPEIPRNEQGYVQTAVLVTHEESAWKAMCEELDAVARRVWRARALASDLHFEAECEKRLIEIILIPAAVAA